MEAGTSVEREPLEITYPADLPVSQRRDDIAEAIRDHQVVVVAGETGSGKTTQLPKICLELGRGRTTYRKARDGKKRPRGGLIGHTQPRRIAARSVAERIAAVEGVEVPVGSLDITMYRDDLRKHPARGPQHTEIPSGGIDGRTVVLVDDVLYSGRTVRAALDAMNDIGRPDVVRLAVLVDRGHRDLPIRADHVGKNLPSARTERVAVRLTELDEVEGVWIS